MKKIHYANSHIHRRGLMIGEDAKKGEIVTKILGPLKFKLNKNKRDALSHPDWVGVKKNYWVDPLRPHKFINHSCDPSTGVRGVTLIALRDLKKGEEITMDYSTIEGDPRWQMKCSCRAKNCRKVIRSVQFLSPKRFKAIKYIPVYFRNLYQKKRYNKRNAE